MEMNSRSNENCQITLTPIQKFYSGLNIFITGGTGFLGQLIVEKLLRSCPSIGDIYLLVREKKEKTIATRLNEILDDVLFERLKDVNPDYKNKVIGIEGDCGLPNLGISVQDRKLLTIKISVVLHAAATVNFQEKLKRAVDTNIKGSQAVINLCKEMVHLKALVHVSTAYSNCLHDVIQETFYPPLIEPKKLITLTDVLDEFILDEITPSLLGDIPNTYIFTKAVGENIVQEEGKSIPVAVYRPSIVISTYKEPLEGWINNLYGAVGVSTAAGAGLLRAINVNPRVNANIIPADMCVNALLAIPWEVQEKYAKTQRKDQPWEIPIYHYESSQDQPIDWQTYVNLSYRRGLPYASSKAIWYFSFNLITHFRVYQIAIFFLHYIPACFMDGIFFILGKKTRFIKLYSKIHRFTTAVSYFGVRNFKFESTRIRNMISKMSPKDQDIFFCDLRKLDWFSYFDVHFKGIRIYLLNDPLSTIPQALKRYRRLYWAHQAVKIIIACLLLRIVWFIAYFIMHAVNVI